MSLKLQIEEDFLRIPVWLSGEERPLHIYRKDEKLYEFMVMLPSDKTTKPCDFYAELPVRELKGQEILLEADAGETFFTEICQSAELLPKEPGRLPWIHFAPKSGWLNDPNGLCLYNGEYHLFFQHNMFGNRWNNISWGHAVSHDLLHWEQLQEALLPDQDGMAFSGSAIADEGVLELFYTAAGLENGETSERRFFQKRAVSRDGRVFEKESEPILPNIISENRDPKVYRFEKSGSYYMVLFLDGHEYAILSSPDKRSWDLTQRLTVEESWECPDLVELPVANSSGERKWVFWTADGYYSIGSFDGKIFTPQQKTRRLYAKQADKRTRFPYRAYAAQTFWGIPDRTVQIPWLVNAQSDFYAGMMGIPRELELIRQKDGYVLAAHLIREVSAQEMKLWEKDLSAEETFYTTWKEDGAALLRIEAPGTASFSLLFGGVHVAWDAEKRLLWVDGCEPEQLEEIGEMVLVLDKGSAEISCCEDTVCFYVETPQTICKELRISGNVRVSLGVIR